MSSQPSIKLTNGTIDVGVLASTPVGTENGLIVRSIPSGTQTISGSISNTGFNLTGIAKGTSTALNGTVKSFDANTNAIDVAVNGSVTVSGTVTANIGTTNGLALDATLTGATAKFQVSNGTNQASVSNVGTGLSSAYGLVVRNIPASGALYNIITDQQAAVTGTITASGVGAGSNVAATAATNYNTATITAVSAAATTATLVFELSDDAGTTWYPTYALRTDNFSAVASDAITASTSRMYQVSTSGVTQVRIRATAFSGGTNITIRITLTASEGEPVSASTATIGASNNIIGQVKITDGTTISAVDAGTSSLKVFINNTPAVTVSSGTISATQGTAASLSGYWPVRVTDGTNTMPTLDVISRAGFFKLTNGTNTATVDASGFITSNINGTVTVSGTVTANIGTTNGLALDATLTGGTQVTKVVGVAKGTSTALNPTVKATDANTNALDVEVNGTVTVSGTVTSNIGTTNGLALDATLTGATAKFQVSNGTNQAAVKNTNPAYNDYGLVVRDVGLGTSYSHIATNTTTTVKSGAGIMRKITLNGSGDTGNIATVYDNTAGSGPVIAVVNLASEPVTLEYDLAFATGLTIVTAGGASNVGDITVTYL